MMRIRSLVFVLCCSLSAASAFGLPTPRRRIQDFTKNQQKAIEDRLVTRNPFLKAKRGFIDKIFDQASSNKDGTVDLSETYEMVLQLYVQLNRQAPIPPPSRQTVFKIFKASDVDKNQRISREEFTKLAHVLGRRAMTRLMAHKVVTLIGAPLLAEYAVRKLSGRDWLHQVAERVVPERFLATLTSAAFYRTFLIILLVATLGNTVLGIVNFVLDVRMAENKGAAEPLDKKKKKK